MAAREVIKATPIRELLEHQDGVLARRQWLAAGQTAKSWNWKLRLGLWKAVIPGVAITHSGMPTDRQRAWAAVLHAGEGTALSGDSALVEQGFQLRRLGGVDVQIPKPRRVVGGELLNGPVLTCRSLTVLDPLAVRESGIPVVEVAAAVVRAAEWAVTERAAEWRLAAVVQQGLTTAVQIRQVLGTMVDLERREAFLRVLDDVQFGAHAGSELAFLDFCRRHALPLPDELQVKVRAGGTRYLDARYRKQRVSVELDGAHHREVAQWEADVLRSLQLAVAARGSGETLIRLTMGNLRHDELEVAQQLRVLLG